MIRRGILIGVFALLPLRAQMANATVQIYDTSAASITCNTVQGSIAIKPFLTFAGAGTLTTAFKVVAKLNGCTVTGATPVTTPPLTIVSGSIKGVLTGPVGLNCLALAAPTAVTGNLIFSWKAAPNQKLDHATTVVTPNTMNGGTFTIGTGSYGNLTADAGSGAVLKPFDATTCKTCGAFMAPSPSLSISALTGEDSGYLSNQCTAVKPFVGIKSITLAIGEVTL